MNPGNPAPDCPVCGEPLDRLVLAPGRSQFDHIGLCVHCTAVICRNERPVRTLTDAEFRAFDPADQASIEYVQRALRQHNRLN